MRIRPKPNGLEMRRSTDEKPSPKRRSSRHLASDQHGCPDDSQRGNQNRHSQERDQAYADRLGSYYGADKQDLTVG